MNTKEPQEIFDASVDFVLDCIKSNAMPTPCMLFMKQAYTNKMAVVPVPVSPDARQSPLILARHIIESAAPSFYIVAMDAYYVKFEKDEGKEFVKNYKRGMIEKSKNRKECVVIHGKSMDASWERWRFYDTIRDEIGVRFEQQLDADKPDVRMESMHLP